MKDPSAERAREAVSRWSPGRVAATLLAGLTALAVRTLFLVHVPQPGPAMLGSYSSDAVRYLAMARRLLAGGGYSFWGRGPDAYVSPGYPVFLALVLRLDPHSGLAAVRWVQAVLGALSAAVAASWAGLFAGLLVAFYPSFVWSTGSILTEVLFLLPFLGYLALHGGLVRRPRVGTALAAGALLGLAVLTRPVVAPVPFAVALVEALLGRGRRAGRRRAAPESGERFGGRGRDPSRPLAAVGARLDVAPAGRVRNRRTGPLGWGGLGGIVAGAAAVNAPWWVRNVLVLHRFVVFNTEASNPLLSGLAPAGARPTVPLGVSAYAFALHYAASQLRTRPRAFLRWMTLDKLQLLFGQAYAGGTSDHGFLQALAGWQGALCCVGAAGLIAAAFLRPSLRPAAVAAAVLTLILLAFIPSPRYAYPVMALLAVGAGALCGEGLARMSHGLRRALRLSGKASGGRDRLGPQVGGR